MVKIESSDMLLWQRIACSEYDAFNEMYERYWDVLLHIALKKMGNMDGAMDLVQDLFIDIWQKRHAIAVQSSLKSYLVSALYFKIFMHFRRQGVQQRHVDHYRIFSEQYDDGELFAVSLYEKNYESLLSAIEHSVQEMPDRVKEVFQLKYYSSLNNQQIAENLGLSTQTVKNQLSKALQQIRRHMESQQLDTSLFAFISVFLFTY